MFVDIGESWGHKHDSLLPALWLYGRRLLALIYCLLLIASGEVLLKTRVYSHANDCGALSYVLISACKHSRVYNFNMLMLRRLNVC